MSSVLVVDGANVVGSVPDGWWKDRAGAARRLHERLLGPHRANAVLVRGLAGPATAGAPAGRDAHVRTVHAARDGDAEIREQARRAEERGAQVVVVTADRALAANVAPAQVLSPSWLLDRL